LLAVRLCVAVAAGIVFKSVPAATVKRGLAAGQLFLL